MSTTITFNDEITYGMEDIALMILKGQVRTSTNPPKCYVITREQKNNEESKCYIKITHDFNIVRKEMKINSMRDYRKDKFFGGIGTIQFETLSGCFMVKIYNVTEKEWEML